MLLENSFNVLYMDTGASIRAAVGALCRRSSPVWLRASADEELWLCGGGRPSDAVAMKDPLYEFSQDDGFDFLALSDFDGSATNRPWDAGERRCPKYDPGGLDPMVAMIEVKICASTSTFYIRASEPSKVCHGMRPRCV
jgi:hypothetical protein